MLGRPAPTSSSPTYRIASDQILDAATAVFAREGYDRANTAAALCESFLYSALRGLDPQLIDAVGVTAGEVAV